MSSICFLDSKGSYCPLKTQKIRAKYDTGGGTLRKETEDLKMRRLDSNLIGLGETMGKEGSF